MKKKKESKMKDKKISTIHGVFLKQQCNHNNYAMKNDWNSRKRNLQNSSSLLKEDIYNEGNRINIIEEKKF